MKAGERLGISVTRSSTVPSNDSSLSQVARSWSSALRLIRDNQDFVFCASQAVQYQWCALNSIILSIFFFFFHFLACVSGPMDVHTSA